jgi:hypothetical protein
MEHNTRKTLLERSQRDYWEFNTKNKNKNPVPGRKMTHKRRKKIRSFRNE